MSSAENENHIATQFLECIKDCFLFQHVREPLRYRSQNVPSILDLILTNEENMVSKLQYKPGLGKSDHLVLEFTYNCYIRSNESPQKNLTSSKGIMKKSMKNCKKMTGNRNCMDLACRRHGKFLQRNLSN